MPITEVSGIAGTVGGGGGGNNMERFAEMMLQMREAKQREAAQKLDTSFKLFEAVGAVPSESDLKGPLKQLGVTLTPDMMEQFASRGQELRTSRQEAARTAVAQRKGAEALAAGQQLDLQKQQQRIELGQRLSKAESEEDRMKILREGVDRGLIAPKDMTEVEQFKLQIAGLPQKEQDTMLENFHRTRAGMFSTDQLAKNTRDEQFAEQQRLDAVRARMDELGLRTREVRTQEERTSIDRQQLALQREEALANRKIRKLQARSATFNAISNFMKENRQTAMDAAKELAAMKKAGYPLSPELEKRVSMELAKSYIQYGITEDMDGEPLGVEALEKLSVGEVPAGISHPIDWLLGKTNTVYLYEPLRRGPEGVDPEAGKGTRDEKPPEAPGTETGRTIGKILSAPWPGSEFQRQLTKGAGETAEQLGGVIKAGVGAGAQEFLRTLTGGP